MKPHRLALTHALVTNYNLLQKMDVYKPRVATAEELCQFHGREYIEFLQRYVLLLSLLKIRRVCPETNMKEKVRFNIFGDCPGFKDLFEFCSMYAGASMDCARKINHKDADIWY